MGTVYKKTFTKPLPPNAEVFTRKGERFAKWKPAKGKTQTAPLITGQDGSDRIVLKAGTYTAKYRDGSGIVREKATGCRDKEAASRVLGDLERRAELVKANVMTAGEDAIADHQGTPLAEHVADFIAHQTAKEVSPVRVANTRSQLQRVMEDCGFKRYTDLSGVVLERWLLARAGEGMSAGTRNQYRAAWVNFANWSVQADRLSKNPFVSVPKADEKVDRRRHRRALSEGELCCLLDVARRRPLLDRLTIRRGKHRGETIARLRPETRAKLERVGYERALIYKTLVLTGLRKGELASLTVGQLDLDASPAYLTLAAADEKNRDGSGIPLRTDLTEDLKQWLAEKLKTMQTGAGQRGDTIPARLPAATPLFNVPAGLIRILDRDLMLAGIPKRDERGRTVDVHALRHTFGTHLSMGGVAPRTAQAAMRHSSIDLTMNVYTDPRLLDVAGAMETLPRLPLDGGNRSREQATGTAGAKSPLAPTLAPKSGKSSKSGSTADKGPTDPPEMAEQATVDVSACAVKRKNPLTIAVNGFPKWAALDSNQRLLPCEDSALTN